jgi:hypothetical protein
MSRLRSRIAGQAGAARAAAGEYHPRGTADTPMVMPMTHVYFGGGGAMVQQMTGLVTAHGGAVIPATAPGQFGQVYLTPMPGRMPSPGMWH